MISAIWTGVSRRVLVSRIRNCIKKNENAQGVGFAVVIGTVVASIVICMLCIWQYFNKRQAQTTRTPPRAITQRPHIPWEKCARTRAPRAAHARARRTRRVHAKYVTHHRNMEAPNQRPNGRQQQNTSRHRVRRTRARVRTSPHVPSGEYTRT